MHIIPTNKKKIIHNFTQVLIKVGIPYSYLKFYLPNQFDI